MRRIIVLLAFATLAGALVFGAAAALNVSSNNLGSGSADVASCDTDGIDVQYDLNATDPTLVDSVTLTGIAGGCDTQALYVVLTKEGDGTLLQAVTGTVSESTTPGSETLSLSPAVSAADIGGVAITITG